jgi:hypothetical protein
VKVSCPRPPAQEVYSTTTQFPSTRAGEQEENASFLDQTVHLIEKVRKALNLIDHNEAVFRSQLLGDPTGIATQGEIDGCIEKVVDSDAFQGVTDEGRLPGLTGSEEKMRLVLQ